VGFLLCVAVAALAQDNEPRRWTQLPVDTNVAGVSYLYTTGDIHVDPELRVENAKLRLHTVVAGYTRYFGLGDMTARVDAQLPVQFGRWNGLLDGVPTTVTREGLADPRVRFSINFVGAPALEEEEFREYMKSHDEHTTVGAAVALRVPLGEYRDDKLINLGENRFSIEPQLGVVHRAGPWSGELTGSIFLYTPNDDFFGGNTLRQDPLYTIQGHLVRSFDGGYWLSADGSYGRGGESRINGESLDDPRSNLLYGVTFGFTLPPVHSFRLGYLRRESLSRVGLDAHNVLLTWSMRF
jgi:hypothetical protein